ncbi:MAG: hypothetical protein KGD68_03075 [Candidatus Lokiarchaeota archaeon]|nr:hypothetical protein [Candidatus Lokiarchaeota archaeon]
MKDDKSSQIKLTGKIPRSMDNAFNLRKLSMREFEAFMILLMHEGEVLSILKQIIDTEFDHKSPTKGYDYINNLCTKGFADKKKTTLKGKQVIRIYVKSTIRKNYDKFMLPTISNVNESLNDLIKDYIEDIKDENKIREKFKAYTENIILAINNLITDAPVKTLSSQRFHRRIYDTIWKYFRSEILKYEVFSR